MRGLRTKLHHLRDLALQSDYPDILILTETWMNDDFVDAELGLINYNVFRRDRDHSSSVHERGGGVLIAIEKKMTSSKCTLTHENVEQLFVNIVCDSLKIIIGTIYMPPRSLPELFHQHVEDVERLMQDNKNKIIIIGDYNLPGVEWLNRHDGLLLSPKPNIIQSNYEKATIISDSFGFLDLMQYNNTPNSNNEYLDLIFSNIKSPNVCLSLDSLVPADFHHPPLVCDFSIPCNFKYLDFDFQSLDFSKANYDVIFNELSAISWQFIDSYELADSIKIFYNILWNIIETHVPIKSIKSSKYPIWFNKDLINTINAKNRAHKALKATSCDQNKIEFSFLRAKSKKLQRDCYNKYVKKIEDGIKSNPKSFWNFTNSKRKNHGLPNTLSYDRITAEDGNGIVNLLATYFESVYENNSQQTHHQDHLSQSQTEDSTSVALSDIDISYNEVLRNLYLLKDSKSPGPDGLPAILLKKCAGVLYKPICDLFRRSLKEGIFPEVWKESFITPIHKSGSKNVANNYRPISILNLIPKIFESIVRSKISPFINSAIIEQQHGFVNGKSTVTNLMIVTQKLLESIEKGYQIDIIYTDFAKAFDKVSIPLLVDKLKKFGFSDQLTKWFSAYMTHRTQFVKYKSYVSRKINVTSGVPQGSHLGPLLFIIFINDIHLSFHDSEFLLFADDCKFYKIIRDQADCLKLHNDLHNMAKWCETNKMKLNVNKCKIQSFSKNNTKVLFNYVCNGTQLERVTSVKDLGVIFDSSLSFIPHLDSIVSSSLKILGFIKRNTEDFRDINTIVTLYKSLVLPKLMYASSIWSPYFEVHIKRLERVQHRFLAYISFKARLQNPRVTHNYAELYKLTNICTLKSNREYVDACLLYKIINDLLTSSHLKSLFTRNNSQYNLRNCHQFIIPTYRTSYCYYSPIARLSRLGNNTRISLVCDSFSSFKRQAKEQFFVFE